MADEVNNNVNNTTTTTNNNKIGLHAMTSVNKMTKDINEANTKGKARSVGSQDAVRTAEDGEKKKMAGNEKEIEEDEEDHPVDKGWAWVVVMGCFFNNLIHCSYFFVISVLFLDIMAVFDTTATVVTLILSMNNFAFCISTQLLVNLLMPVISVRTLTTTCAIIYALSTLIIVACPRLPVFFIISNIKYIAQGGVLVPSITLVGHYFKRWRALATALSLLGISVASIAIPPVTRYLRDEYGFRGAFLIMAGYEMNAIVSSLLLRPLSCYRPKKAIRRSNATDLSLNKLSQQNVCTHDTEDTGVAEMERMLSDKYSGSTQVPHCKIHKFMQLPNDRVRIENEKEFPALMVSCDEESSNLNDISSELGHTKDTDLLQEKNRPPGGPASPTCVPDILCHNTQDKGKEISETGPSQILRNRLGNVHNLQQSHVQRLQDKKTSSLEKLSTWSLATVSLTGSCVNLGESAGMLSQTANVDKSLVFKPHEEKANKDIVKKKHSRCSRICLKAFRLTLDTALLKNYIAVLAVISFALNYTCVFVTAYLPSYAVQMGVSKSNAAVLLTIVGVTDVIFRAGFGYFADLRFVRPSRIIACTSICMGLVCQFVPFYTCFGSLIFMAVSFGVFGLTGLTLNSPLIVDLLGVQNLGKMLALGTLIASIVSSVQYPIHGAMIESSGSFVASFHYIGANYILGGLLLLLEPVVVRLQSAKERQTLKNYLEKRDHREGGES